MATSRTARLFRMLLVAMIGGAVIVGVLYRFFGLRYAPSGSGFPRLGFVTAHERQAAEIERHRAAQRLDSAPRSTSPVDDPPATAEVSAPSPDPSTPGTSTTSAPTGPAYWTDVRGPARDGRYSQAPVLRIWPAEGLQPLWRQPVGAGYAGFVIAHDRAFTIEQRGRSEVVSAYDVKTGRELWTRTTPALFEEAMGGDGPRATPTWANGLVYALGALGELQCLDAATGRVLWRVNILDDNGARNLQWGMSASPLVLGEAVIVLPGGPNGRSVVAYHARTGQRLWSSLDDQQAYTSPMLVRLAGRDQLMVVSATRVMGLTPERGDLLWAYPWAGAGGINVAQPIVVGDDRVFISAGYGVGAALVELTSRADSPTFDVREVWRNSSMKNKFTSSVLHEGFVYGLDEAILACVDVATGRLKWKGGRYGYGQLLLAGDRLVVLTEGGDLVLVSASPTRHEELGRFSAIEGKSWNHLALDQGRLLVRNLQEMAAFDISAR